MKVIRNLIHLEMLTPVLQVVGIKQNFLRTDRASAAYPIGKQAGEGT